MLPVVYVMDRDLAVILYLVIIDYHIENETLNMSRILFLKGVLLQDTPNTIEIH